MWTRIKSFFHACKLKTKLTALLLALFFATVSISSWIYMYMSSRSTLEEISLLSIQTLSSISSNLNSTIKSASYLSYALLAHSDIQQMLSTAPSERKVNQIFRTDQAIFSVASTSPLTLSIYIYDNDGNRYYRDPRTFLDLTSKDVRKEDWYPRLKEADGNIIVEKTADIYASAPNDGGISIIRMIKNLDTLQPIGTIIVNVSGTDIQNCYQDYIKHSNTRILITDKDNHFLIPFDSPYAFDLPDMIARMTGFSGTFSDKHDGKNHLVSYLNTGENDWKLISVIELDSFSKNSKHSQFIVLILFVMSSGIMILGILGITSAVTRPINRLAKQMKHVLSNEFEAIPVEFPESNEIGYLQACYNTMTQKIQGLIENIQTEQRLKRKMELNMLLSQLKPHFLYNAIDNARALTLSGEKKEVNTLLKALGNYYRAILNKGQDIITLGDEIDTIRAYITIESYKTGDQFQVTYQIEEGAERILIPKFILQPLVENCIKHGMWTSYEPAEIKVSARLENSEVVLSVSDNGIGMDAQKIKDILNPDKNVNISSFGLRATIERLRLFYNLRDIVKIESTPSVGTTVIIRIPQNCNEE